MKPAKIPEVRRHHGHRQVCVNVHEDLWADEGSARWYGIADNLPPFVAILYAGLPHASPADRARLRRSFPQLVAAYESRDPLRTPGGFAPRYDSWPGELV